METDFPLFLTIDFAVGKGAIIGFDKVGASFFFLLFNFLVSLTKLGHFNLFFKKNFFDQNFLALNQYFF